MSKGKTSESAKANYSRYESERREEKNAKARLERHMKTHSNDTQSANRVKPQSAGKSHTKVSQLAARAARSIRTGAFGTPGKNPVDCKAALKALKAA